MEQYPIPQFIESEGRIAFFITFRQFFYLVGAGAVCFILYYVLPFILFMFAGAVVFIIAGAFGFAKVNGAPLEKMILSYIGFFSHSKDFVWKKKESAYPFRIQKRQKIEQIEAAPSLNPQKSRIKNMKKAVELNIKK